MNHRHVYKLKKKYYCCIACSKKILIFEAQDMFREGKLFNMVKNDITTLFEPLPSDNRDERREAAVMKWQKASPWLKRRMSEGLNYNHEKSN